MPVLIRAVAWGGGVLSSAAAVAASVDPAIRAAFEQGGAVAVERTGAGLCLVGAMLFASAARRSGWRGIWTWALSAVAFLVAGEWVRWFGGMTLAAGGSGAVAGAVGLSAILAVGVVLPVADRTSPRVRRAVASLGVPLLPLPLVGDVVVASALIVVAGIANAPALASIGQTLLAVVVALYAYQSAADAPATKPSPKTPDAETIVGDPANA